MKFITFSLFALVLAAGHHRLRREKEKGEDDSFGVYGE